MSEEPALYEVLPIHAGLRHETTQLPNGDYVTVFTADENPAMKLTGWTMPRFITPEVYERVLVAIRARMGK